MAAGSADHHAAIGHNGLTGDVTPGLIKTDFAKALHEDPVLSAKYNNETPLRRMGEPDDIGGVAVFLASPAGRYVTGQTVVADGGMMIR